MKYHLLIWLLLMICRECLSQSNMWEIQAWIDGEEMMREYQENPPTATEKDFEPFRPENLLADLVERMKDKPDNKVECFHQIGYLFTAFKNSQDPMHITALNAIDSWGKPGPGILRGRQDFIGLYHQCIDAKFQNGSHRFEGDYFRIYIDSKFGNMTSAGFCSRRWGLDVCLPKVCKSSDLETKLKGPSSRICKVKWINDYVAGFPKGGYIVGAVMLLIFGLCFVMGTYDYCFGHVVKDNPLSKTLWFKMLMSFSFYRNVCEIFNTKGCNKPGQIGPIHCIRFFSMCWIISGHILSLMIVYGDNPLDVVLITYDTATQILTNSYFSVDSFFFISGLLLAFIWFKDFNKNKRRAMSPLAWTMFYVHRIIRLSPPYFFLILFFTFVFQTWEQNAPILLKKESAEPCLKNWWVDLLYLTNFIHFKQQCYLVAWYLATDLQIYLFTPILLIPLALNKRIGVVVALLVWLICVGVNIFEVIHFHFPLTSYAVGIKQDPRMSNKNYKMMMNDAPWMRCPIYIQGMLVGYFLQNWRGSIRLSPIVKRFLNVVCWIGALALMITTIMVVRSWIRNEYWPVGWRAIYSAFSKPAWGVGLSWIIISCYYGYGGPINSFMSWNIWVPLGRLTYCAYLIHIAVVLFLFANHKTELIWSNFFNTFVELILPSIAMAYFMAIFWSSAFEISLGKVEMLLIGGLRRPPPKVEPKPAAAAVEKGDVREIPIKVQEKIETEKTTVPAAVYPAINGNNPDKPNWT